MSETFEIILNDDASNSATTKTFNISDGSISRVAGFTGRGTPDPVWGLTETIKDDGALPTRLRFAPRVLTLDLLWETTTDDSAITRREQIYEAFRPRLIGSNNFDQKASLRVTRSDSSVRQIDFTTNSIIDVPFDPGNNLSIGQRSAATRITLLCPDPMWYDPTPISLDDGGSPSSSSWNPLDVADTSADMWPVVTVVGPITNFRFDLYGVGSSRSVNFFLSTIGASETITIDTRPFRRSITDQTGADRTDLLFAHIGLDAMKIYADWDADSATQSSTASGSSTTGATDVSWFYHKRYMGI